MCSAFDYTFHQSPQKTEGNNMVNLITLHARPIHTIHILSPDSDKNVRLITTFHFEVSGEQLPTSIST